jgi:acyl-CoA dehydrogenase
MAENSLNPVPFSEPPYLRGLPSPYYTEKHLQFQKRCRAFAWEHLVRHAMEWEKEGTVPEHVFQTFCKHNMLLPNLPSPLPVAWLKRLGIHDILGVKVEEWDHMYTGIYCDEVCFSVWRIATATTHDGNRWPDQASAALEGR